MLRHPVSLFEGPAWISQELLAMGVMDEPVEDGVSIGGLVYGAMPGLHRKLADDDGGCTAVSVFEDLEQIMARLRSEGFQAQSSRIRS
jgi:hypothetical protein